ncbi:MAG: hypothetical protein RBT59_06500 [Arcobacteraceae bacterium]|jgi:hypothetical protein|nr:hypothetical protein [Arcobacteraceae bacterium]
MNTNDKYNMLVKELPKFKDKCANPQDFGLSDDEFKNIIGEIERDGLFKKGYFSIDNYSYGFMGLTFKGESFLENNYKKEYHKTEINYNHNVTVGGDNHGNIITGNDNTIVSKFEKKFDALIQAINNSNIQDKEIIIQELQNNKNDDKSFKKSLGSVLTKGAEFGSIVSAVSALLSL